MSVRILVGDCRDKLRDLPDASVNCCVTSPPYFGLRDYGHEGQMGLEPTPDEFVAGMVEVFREVRRVLRDDGVLFLNIGDSYASSGGQRQYGSSDGSTGRGDAPARRVLACDISGRAESGSQDRGSSFESHDGERTGFWWSRIADTDAGRVLALAVEPLSQIRASMEELLDHLPTEDCVHRLPSALSSAAILDRAQNAIRAVELLHGALPSIPGGCVPPLLASCRLSDSASACLWSLRSFAACVQRFAHRLDALAETPPRMADTASPFEELASHIQGTVASCSTVSSWVEFKPERSTLKAKDLIGIPWMLAFALRADGWYLRQDLIWSKPNPMPESVRDRCTKAHEYLFLLSKGPKYYFDAEAIAEPVAASTVARLCQDVESQIGSERVPGKTNGRMKAVVRKREAFNGEDAVTRKERGHTNHLGTYDVRNKRSVWEVATQPFSEAHFATYPPALIEPCILAGCPKGGTVLDPFGGAGTTGLVADRLQRDAILIELNPEYAGIAERRLSGEGGMFADVKVAA